MPELTSEPVPELLAAETRKLIEFHNNDWDSLHAFVGYHWDGQGLRVGTWAAIDPEHDPDLYPKIMRMMSYAMIGDYPHDPPYAYGLQFEGFAVQGTKNASAEERAQLAVHGAAGPHGRREDARECAIAIVADIHGHIWCARRYRGEDSITQESDSEAGRFGGRFTEALATVARATGLIAWGLQPDSDLERAANDSPAAQRLRERLTSRRASTGQQA